MAILTATPLGAVKSVDTGHHYLGSQDMAETWGSPDDPQGERVRLGVDTQDEAEPWLCIDYLPNGRVASGTVVVPIEDGPQLALAILRLTAAVQSRPMSELLAELLASDEQT
jgi:hypothetical protein